MSTTDSQALLEAALDYAGRGWRVIPLHNQSAKGSCTCKSGKKCSFPGKHPRLLAWQKAATNEQEVIEGWWSKWPTANVGVVFGEHSGIIDAECDTAEEEKILLKLWGGDLPVTVCFKSSRGKHWLFRWREGLPAAGVHKIGALGIRLGNDTKGAMSVFPPSLHPSGVRYEWIVSPDEAEIAEVPDDVVARLWNWVGADPNADQDGPQRRPMEHWQKVLGGVAEGARDSSMISYIGKLLRGASDLGDETTVQVLYESVRAVNARNKPPLPEEALRGDFLSILKAEQNRRTTEAMQPALRNPPEKQVEKGPDLKGMRLVIVRSDPPLFELYAPQFSRAVGGCLVLTAEQLVSAKQIKVQALKQADYPLPKTFGRIWEGTAKEVGLYERLVFHAEERDAPREQKRRLVVVELLRVKLGRARVLKDGQDPDSRGHPCKLDDGSIVFGFTTVLNELAQTSDKITRNELSTVLEEVGVKWYAHKQFKRLTPAALQRLDALLHGDQGTEEST